MRLISIQDRRNKFEFSTSQLAKFAGYASALIGVQRILLNDFYSLVCIVPYLAAFMLNKKDLALRNSMLILALYLSVDQGAETYSETPAPIRYLIYLTILYIFVNEMRFSLEKLKIFLFCIFVWLVLAILNLEFINYDTLLKDLLILFLVGIVTVMSDDSVRLFRIDLQFLAYAILVVLFAELLQIATVFDYRIYGYLSYDSTKFLLVLPAVYFICEGRTLAFVVSTFLIGYVLLLYGTRMIPLAFLTALLVYLIPRAGNGNKHAFAILALFVSVIWFFTVNLIEISEFKLISSFVRALDGSSISAFFRLLDPIRYGELELLFSRSFFEILVGSGPGTGIVDQTGIMSLVSVHQTAFDEQELRSGIFFGFHDIWTDFGVRFGLIAVFLIYAYLTKQIVSNKNNKCTISIMAFMAVTCAFFSTSGLILCTYIFLALRSSLTSDEIG